MHISSGRKLASVGALVVVLTSIGFACARDGGAQVSSDDSAVSATDSVSIASLLRVVRSADPLLCELAIRSVDTRNSWWRAGPVGDSPLESDSAAAAVLRWIQDRHDDPAAVPRLAAALRDTDACVRRVASSLLGRIEHVRAHEALLTALEDPSADTRQVAALGVGLGEVAEASQSLIRRLRDDSPQVRRAAAWALGSLEQASALVPLIETLERDPDARVRQAAAWAIGRSRD
jgi:hypothetical protein